jgi:DNA modification methylase
MAWHKLTNCKLAHGDCLEMMKEIPDGMVDLTVTSPPYDNLRTYNGTLEWGDHVWKPVLEHLFRVTKSGGVVVWIVNDATIKGSETGTSFRQALYAKEIGFNLHDTMIWNKPNPIPGDGKHRYHMAFEYMFVFSRDTPNSKNLIRDKKNTTGGKTLKPSGDRRTANNRSRPEGTTWNVQNSVSDQTCGKSLTPTMKSPNTLPHSRYP